MNQAMISEIHDHITKLFDPEDECCIYDMTKIDATEFFTSLFQAQTVLFNELTESNKTYLEFSYLANQIVVQDLMERKGA
ncbi:hypothetical protein [Paenibacillus amylolyticus]|uniref:hypothetical protein n=1 Tax=Paenibacillus amylolyticus TaxID=1451 RepID=UPI000B853F0D|nr:hypothetical protein [Paenibacillus amylolyticus]